MSRAYARVEYTYRGTYLTLAKQATDHYLDAMSDDPNSFKYPYDQEMSRYYEEEAALRDHQRRLADNMELNTALSNMLDHDAVLDAYIDANPDKFTYVAYTDNEEDIRLAGLRQWADLRMSAIGG